MIDRKQKSPSLAETGFSENIHLDAANETYRSMILDNPHCENFCIELLAKFDMLLDRFAPNSSPQFNGSELDAFIALVNLEKAIDSQGVRS